MHRKRVAYAIAIVAIAVMSSILPNVSAGTTDVDIQCSVTVSGEVNISVNYTTFDAGSITYGSDYHTTPTRYRVYNNGTVNTNIQIKLKNVDGKTDGDEWTFASSAGTNQCVMNATTDGDGWATPTIAYLTTSYQTLISNLPTTGTNYDNFGLGFTAPTDGSDTGTIYWNITIHGVSV